MIPRCQCDIRESRLPSTARLDISCALSTSFIGSVSHPAGDRPSHPICPLGPCGPKGTYSEETAKQRPENFLGVLSNSGPAVRLYSEGWAPEDRYRRGDKLVCKRQNCSRIEYGSKQPIAALLPRCAVS